MLPSKVLRSSLETVVASYSSVFKYLLNKENVCTILSLGIGSTSVDLEFLFCLSNAFSLSISEKIIVGLVLAESENPVIRFQGKNFSTPLIDQLWASPVNPTNQIYHFIELLSLSRSLSNHVSLITKMISLDKSKDRVSFPFQSLPSYDLCKGNFMRSGFFPENCDTDYDFISGEMDMGRSPEPSVAQIISATARTCSGLVGHQHVYLALPLVVGFVNLSDQHSMSSWNIDVLVDSIKQLASGKLLISG